MSLGGSLIALAFLTGCASSSAATHESADNVQEIVAAKNLYTDSLNAIKSDPRVLQAMNIMVTDRDLNNTLLIEINEVPAPPFGEEKRAARFAEMLREVGLTDVTIDATGNVIGRRKGTEGTRNVALVAHIDTVFPIETDVSVKIEGDTYTAPGIGDNARGMVVLLSLLKAMNETGLETRDDVLFIGSVGEEGLGDLRGVKALFEPESPKIDSFIAIDGGSLNRLIYAGIGSHRYRVSVNGPGGHSWGDFGYANPHHALGRAIDLFSTRAPAISASGPKTSFNVGRIGGGTSINSVPFESWMEVDMRSSDQSKLDDMDDVFQAAMIDGVAAENAARSKGPEITLDVKMVGRRPAGEGDVNSDLVQQTMAAMQSLGITPSLRASSTDANIPISLGIPAVTLSRGGKSKGAHGFSESWTDIDSHIAVQLTLLTVLQNTGFEPAP